MNRLATASSAAGEAFPAPREFPRRIPRCPGQRRVIHEGVCIVYALALLLAQVVVLTFCGSGVAQAELVIDPNVRALVQAGRARVIVTLQVGETADETLREQAIHEAQDAVLARLPHSHASVVRRYTSIPMLALEIDATALHALEAMTDVVVAVTSDSRLKPQ
jgi:hypothetical protein